MRTGIATFTLDYGKCPKWLFERMVRLCNPIIKIIIKEYGEEEFVKRISDPVWFQSLGTVLAFDWNASGLTTILTAVLKEAIKGEEKDLGIFICGGKGKTSRKTPEELYQWGEKLNYNKEKTENLVYNSKMVAKVDSCLIQDGYQIYHHCFIFSKNGSWSVVQQGMNIQNQTARRYHWYSKNIKSLTESPHKGIISEKKKKKVLNLVSQKSRKTKNTTVELVNKGFYEAFKEIKIIKKHYTPLSKMIKLKFQNNTLTLLHLEDKNFYTHKVLKENLFNSKYLFKILYNLCEKKPKNYEDLLYTKGVGPKTIRALTLVSEVIYGAHPSYQDPARYSFAHGGKDKIPYPVDTLTYDKTIKFFENIVEKSKISPIEKDKILKHLKTKLSDSRRPKF